VPDPNMSRTTHSRHRGTAYVLALGLALLVGAVATGTILATRARFAGEADVVDLARAEATADAAIGYALRTLNGDSTYAGGTVPAASTSTFSFNGGTARLRIAPGTAVDSKSLVPATITVAATVGRAVRRYRVDALPAITPFAALEQAVSVAGTLGVSAGVSLTLASGSHSTAGVLVPTGTVVGSIETVGLGQSGGTDALQASMLRPAMPTADHIDALRAAGTSITIPATAGSIIASGFLLSPTANPYGMLNQRGIYVLDCGGRTLNLSEIRIVGTLIIVDPGVGSMISGGMLGEAAVPGMPSLVVVGSLFLNGSAARLIEGTANFNPQGTPYPYVGGTVDSDLIDQRICGFDAPVIVTGSLSIAGSLRCSGLVVAGDCAIGGNVSVTRSDWAAWAPPAELRAARWRLDQSTRVEVSIDP
jgi:hypothetical protein